MHLRLCSLILLAFAMVALGQANRGSISGTVFDASTGRPIPLVTVEVDGMTGPGMTTDTEGRFTIPLAPGTYKIRFTNANYLETTVEDVQVVAGEVAEASTVMQQKGAVTTVEVTEKISAVSSTAESILTERKLAVSVSDSISKEDLRNTPAFDAASALEKVTGVSVVDGGYVYIRGLGERYSSTMLNNAMLPTTEPERRVVPLDMFPATLIDNIKVIKTYSPDLPGEFSGGLVQMQTIEFPTQKVLTASVSYGVNTLSSFNRFNSFSGGSRDWLGFDDGTRSLPSIIPDDPLLFVGNYTEQQFQEFGRSFPVNYSEKPIENARPFQTYAISGGNTIGRLGIVGAFTFSNQPQRYPELRRFTRNFGQGAIIFSDYPQFNVDNENARMGGVFNASVRLNSSNKIVFRNTLTHDADKEMRIYTGYNGGNDTEIENTRLRFIQRTLFSTGVGGDHASAKLGNSVFRWQFTYSDSRRDEPDLRETIRARDPGSNQPLVYANVPEGGIRFFSDLKDRIYEPQADWSAPFFKGQLSGLWKAGFRGTVRRRDFNARRFRFFPVRAVTIDFTAPTNDVLSTANIRPDGWVLREITRGTDQYTADMDIFAGFGMVDLAIGPRWRVVGGIRFEDAQINVTTINPLVPGNVPTTAALNNRDPLPGVNAIYALNARQNLRFGYGRTVNRPDFRELSPFEFTNVVGGYTTAGNPNLRRATIDNYDARWEWFLGGNQVIAASFFFKRFTDPIEQLFQPTASELRQSFGNVFAANNQGIEFEFRRNLSFIRSGLRDFSLQTNFTFVDSDVEIPDLPEYVLLTSRNRPLVGQSRYIYNVIGEWAKPQWRSNARVFLNSVSRRITDVGTFELPDAYQERVFFLDAVYQVSLDEQGKWSLRFSGENLTNNLYRYTQQDILIRQFQIGRNFTFGMSYSFF
jgi:outer membrane receptor protein involved in Fe transport